MYCIRGQIIQLYASFHSDRSRIRPTFPVWNNNLKKITDVTKTDHIEDENTTV